MEVMRYRLIALLVGLSLVTGTALAQEDREALPINVGMQSTGTFSWVVHAMQYFGIDEEYGLDLEPVTYASKQATELALRAGDTDIVVDDFVGAVQMRERGVPVQAVYPYGKAVGGVVVGADSGIESIADLEGRTIAAASLDDKSLLILRALTTSQYGFDPQTDGETLAAAPFLMQGLLESGEIDAGIPYWHFVPRITHGGEFEDLMMVTDMLDELGLRSDLPILVLVAHEDADDEAVSRFVEAMIETFERMRADDMDGVWQSILDEELYALPDPAAFPAVRERWEAGLPEEWNQEMIDGLTTLVENLVEIAGADIVGISELPADAFTTDYAP